MLSIIKLRLMRLKNEYIVFVIMTAMALLFAFLFSYIGSSDYTPKILLVDNDESEYSLLLIEELKEDSTFKYELTNYEDAIENVNKGKVKSAIIIDKGFGDKIENGEDPGLSIAKIKDDVDVYTLERLVASITGKMIGNIKIAEMTSEYVSEYSNSSKKDIFNNAYKKAVEYWKYRKPIEVSKNFISAENLNGYNNTQYSIIGFSIFFSMYTVVFAIGEILNERKYRTWQRLIVSPISKASLLGGNLVVTFAIGLIQLSVLFMAGKYIFGIELGKSILGIITVSAGFVFAVTSLGLFLSGIVKTHSQLATLSPVVLTSLGMLGGCMWPLEIVSNKILLTIAEITPTKWAVQGLTNIIMYGKGFEAIVIPTIVLIIMGLVFFGAGIRMVKYN
ncbi:ABC transporter permease [Caldisalinibacter kiritimatiensis]|uniref:Multidrug ABC transporter permease n=1 Tax=Caldisalinibacter kiritimatiensis TaxID=1304284 RepID=R1CLK0_9FIRM|nr:ABC transporter permease [Caldisalinibacter kiritimatiensis]EOC99565.1 multidrug ABC transporter permease [Caldisalinibacter kiritimatiensis]